MGFRSTVTLAVGALLAGGLICGAVFSSSSTPADSQATLTAPHGLATAAVDALIASNPAEADRLTELRAGRADADRLIETHGVDAGRAYALLAETGIDLLNADLPDYDAYIAAPTFLLAKPGLAAIDAYLVELLEQDPSRVNDLFRLLASVPADSLALLREYPQALPALVVAPEQTRSLIARHGSRALDTLLRFTPDSYPAVAALLSARADSVFAVEDMVAASAPERVMDMLALYFFEFGKETTWLEKRIGPERTLFVLTSNLSELVALRARDGDVGVATTLQAVLDYAASPVSHHRVIAEACTSIPGTLPLFREGAGDPEARDWFIANYANVGGATLLTRCYEREHWTPLMRAVMGLKGDAGFLPLVCLADPRVAFDTELIADIAPDERKTLDVRARFRAAIDQVLGEGGTDKVQLLLQVMSAALSDGAKDNAQKLNWGQAAEMLNRILDGKWDLVPDAYVDREVWWLWDILPGRDAWRLGRLMIEGYVPSWQEWVNGGWDAINVGIFVVKTATGVVDCTQAVQQAIGGASIDALGRALMVVGEHALRQTLTGMLEYLTEPAQLVKLAVCGAYFAFDAFLKYGPLEFPAKTNMIEVNDGTLTPFFRAQFYGLLRTAVLKGLWRPEFDAQGETKPLELLNPAGELDGAGKIELAIANLDRTVAHNVLSLLEANDRRRRFVGMLGLAGEQFGDLLPFGNGDGENNNRDGDGSRPSSFNESEDILRQFAPTGRVVLDNGDVIALNPSLLRPIATERGPSPIVGRTVTFGRDGSVTGNGNARFLSYLVDHVLHLLPHSSDNARVR